MARTATKKAAPEPTPEVDLSDFLNKDPSVINRAEAAWLVECTGLDLDMDPMDLVERVVQLVAGSAHRAWQKSEAAADLHAEAAERRAAAEAAKPARKAKADDDEEEEAAEKPRRGRPRKAVVEDDEEEEPVKPPARRGRPAKAKVVEPEEEEEEETVKPARRGRPARKPAGSEAPF